MRNQQLIRDNVNLSKEQKQEILEEILAVSWEKAHVRRCDDETNANQLKSAIDAYANGTICTEKISQEDLLNFITCLSSTLPGANKRHIYVIFYTNAGNGEAPASLLKTPLTARIPRTNGKSQFSLHDGDFNEPIVAGGVVGFNEASIKTPEAFEKAMHDYLTLFKGSELTVARKIESAQQRFQMDKRVFAYKSPKDNIVEHICNRLGSEFGIKMEVKYARGSMGLNGHFNVKTITW